MLETLLNPCQMSDECESASTHSICSKCGKMRQKIWLETIVENELSNIKKRDLESQFNFYTWAN